MIILGNRQNIVTDITEGEVNDLNITIPREVVKVGNTIGLVVRVSDKICWVGEHNIAQDGAETVALTAMTNTTGSDTNSLKYRIDKNILSFDYTTSKGAEEKVNTNVNVAIIYHRNFD